MGKEMTAKEVLEVLNLDEMSDDEKYALIEELSGQLGIQPLNPDPITADKPCLFCKKMLEAVFGSWEQYQPYDGGEVQFTFSYGSKYDTNVYKSIICEECAEKYIKDMDADLIDFSKGMQ